MANKGWNVVDAERAVLWREYEFTKGAFATTLVFRGSDGLVVVSPGRNMESADLDELEKYGEVKALVANNSFHHLGQPVWRTRFPKAESYAAPSVVAKLNKKVSSIKFKSTDELPLSSDARAHVLPGLKNGELLFTVPTQSGSLWYTGDLLTNMHKIPGPPLRWLFTLTDSAPGYRLFRLSLMIFANNKPALKEHMTKVLSESPPAMIVPGHGPAVTSASVAAETKTQLDRL